MFGFTFMGEKYIFLWDVINGILLMDMDTREEVIESLYAIS